MTGRAPYAVYHLVFGLCLGGGVFAAGAAVKDQLPDPLATHFDLSGRPDGSMGMWVGLVLPALLVALPVVLTSTASARVRRSTIGYFGSLAVLVQGLVVYANYDAPTWHRARAAGWWSLPLLLAVPPVVALALVRTVPSTAPIPHAESTQLHLSGSERAVWSGSAENRVMQALNALMLAAGVLLPNPLLIVAALIGSPFTRLRLQVGTTGAVLRLGLPTVFHRRYSLDVIAKATAARYENLGWGYRGSRHIFRAAVVSIRRGEALQLHFTDGTSTMFTVDDAERGAELVNALIDRRATV